MRRIVALLVGVMSLLFCPRAYAMPPESPLDLVVELPENPTALNSVIQLSVRIRVQLYESSDVNVRITSSITPFDLSNRQIAMDFVDWTEINQDVEFSKSMTQIIIPLQMTFRREGEYVLTIGAEREDGMTSVEEKVFMIVRDGGVFVSAGGFGGCEMKILTYQYAEKRGIIPEMFSKEDLDFLREKLRIVLEERREQELKKN